MTVADPPLPELAERLKPALERMIAILREKERGNPYIHVYEAALAAGRDSVDHRFKLKGGL